MENKTLNDLELENELNNAGGENPTLADLLFRAAERISDLGTAVAQAKLKASLRTREIRRLNTAMQRIQYALLRRTPDFRAEVHKWLSYMAMLDRSHELQRALGLPWGTPWEKVIERARELRKLSEQPEPLHVASFAAIKEDYETDRATWTDEERAAWDARYNTDGSPRAGAWRVP